MKLHLPKLLRVALLAAMVGVTVPCAYAEESQTPTMKDIAPEDAY